MGKKLWLSEIYTGMHNYELARKNLEKVIEARPEISFAWRALGCLNHAEGKPDEAIKHLKKAIRLAESKVDLA